MPRRAPYTTIENAKRAKMEAEGKIAIIQPGLLPVYKVHKVFSYEKLPLPLPSNHLHSSAPYPPTKSTVLYVSLSISYGNVFYKYPSFRYPVGLVSYVPRTVTI